MRRLVAAVAAAAVAAAAGGTLRAVTGHAASGCVAQAPVVNGISPTSGPVGTSFTVAGANLASPTCVATVVVTDAVQGKALSYAVTGTPTSGALQFTLNQPASGPLTVVFSSQIGQDVSNSDYNLITTPAITAPLPATPVEGQQLVAAGTGLLLGGQTASASISYAPSAGSCPAAPSPSLSDTAVTLPALSAYCRMSATLNLSAWTKNTDHSQPATPFSLPLGSLAVAPVVSNGALGGRHVTAGGTLTLSGTGFGTSGSGSVGGEPTAVSFSDRSVGVHVPDGAVNNAAVSAVRSDGVALPVSGGIDVDARVDGIAPSSAAVGDAVTISGGGFGTDAGTVSIGSSSFPVRSWSPTSIVVTVPSGATGGVPGIQPRDTGAPASAPSLTVVPRITGVNPTHAAPGGAFEVVGTSFGQPQSGDALSVGGVPAAVSLWSDTQIVATVPPAVHAGATTVSVTVAGAPALTTSLTVDPAAAAVGSLPPGPVGSRPGSTASPTPGLIAPAPGGPIVTGSPPPFHRPTPQPGAPVTVTLSAPATEAAPGQQVPLTATVIAFGKPAAGVTVDFVLVVVPGGDAALSAPSAVTDQQGRASVLLRLSRTAGDTIVLARAGQFQDEMRVAGRGAGTAVGAASAPGGGDGGTGVVSAAAGSPQRLLIVGLLLVCLVLFLSGFAIQLRASSGGVAVAGVGSGPAGRVVEASLAGGAVLQFAVAMLAAILGRAVAGVRRA